MEIFVYDKKHIHCNNERKFGIPKIVFVLKLQFNTLFLKRGGRK